MQTINASVASQTQLWQKLHVINYKKKYIFAKLNENISAQWTNIIKKRTQFQRNTSHTKNKNKQKKTK